MIQSRIPQYIKLIERNHVEKNLLDQLAGLGWDIILLLQDLFTVKKRITPMQNQGELNI